jgi:Dyp-type peroxidase family
MWVGRLRQFILVLGLWSAPVALVVSGAHWGIRFILGAWPEAARVIFAVAAVLAAALILRWLLKRPLAGIRQALTPKYWGKIARARTQERADPFRKPTPFRLDPETASAGITLGARGLSKSLAGAGLRLIRILAPNARIWPIPMRLVTRYEDVQAVLGASDTYLTAYGAEMQDMGEGTNFVLGMNGAEHTQARKILDDVVGELANPGDRARVAARAAEVARALVDHAPGRLDVVADLIRRTATETCIDYLGLEAPDPDALADWTLGMNQLVFADPFGAPETRDRALQAARLFRSVVERSLEIGTRRPAADTLVTRLLALEASGRIARPEIIAFLTGNATGIIPTTTIGMTGVIGELWSRPIWWEKAGQLATQIRAAGPGEAPEARTRLLDILMEAARLSPTLYPGQFRLAGQDAVVAPGTLRAAKVQRGDLLMVATASALRDGRRFQWPDAFNPDRTQAEKQAAELMFGAGVHKCVGIHLAKAVMVEIAIALLSRKDLAPAPGEAGKVRSAGPYPRHMEMTWQAEGAAAGQTLAVIAAPLPASADITRLSDGLEALRQAGGRDDLDRSGIIHFASFSVVDLHRDPQGVAWPGRTPESRYWLVGDINFDGELKAGLARITAEMAAWIPTFQIADPGIQAPADLACYLECHVLDIRATPWGATGLQYPGSIGLPVSDLRKQRDLAGFVREVVEVLNAHGSLEPRDGNRPAGGVPDAVQILDAVRRLIRRDPEIVTRAAGSPEITDLLIKGAEFRSFLIRPLGPRLAFSDYRSAKGWASPPLGEILATAFRDRNRGAVLGLLFALAVAVTTTFRIFSSQGAVPDPLGILWTAVSSLVWVTAVMALTAVALGGAFMALLLAHEAVEKTDVSLPAPNRVDEVETYENEDGYAQNHMLSVTWVKPGPFRRFTLALGMWTIRLLVTTALRQGDLGRMVSVHFARWVKPPGSDAVLFISSYDGSWVSYLEDFSALAPQGVNLAWGHSRGFPTPKMLIFDGCEDSDSFKRFAKRSLRPTQFWYSAYPDLTLENTRRNALIHDGLMRAANATEAQDWLDLLASVKRPEREIETDDVQTLVLRGLGSLPVLQCGLVSLTEGADLSGWTAELARRVTFGNEDPDPEKRRLRRDHGMTRLAEEDFPDRPEDALFVAFTASGLSKLGLPEPQSGVGLAGMLSPFYQGMSSRERVLRDGGASAPSQWEWSDSSWTGGPVKPEAVDAVLLAYGRTEAGCARAIHDQVSRFGLTLRKILVSPDRKPEPDGLSHEPFGFADGISNPVMKGLRGNRGAPGDQVEAGEILLGYPHERPGKVPTCAIPAHLDPLDILPAILGETPVETSTEYTRYPAFGRDSGAASDHDFGRNGTFLVVRQLEQDVAGFNNYTRTAAAELAALPGVASVSPHWVAAKMVGRWKDGSPIVLHPDAQPRKPDPTNNFTYADIDPRGFACPLGSHVRRTNPRDSLDSDQPKAPNHISSHRILRRGRTYAEPVQGGPGKREGLIFLAACADLERQFELVQQAWLGNPSFHGLTGESDPVIDSDGKGQSLSLPDGRTVRRLKGIPDFVTVRGGGYFFMPSRSALHYLADRNRRRT